MTTNADQTPKIESSALHSTAAKQRWTPGLRVVLVNSLLFVLLCVPGFLPLYRCRWLESYFLVIGFPTTLAILISPDTVHGHPHAFVMAYIVNIVVVSYLLGQSGSWLIGLWRNR